MSNGQLRGKHSTKATVYNSNSARLSATLSTRQLVHKIYNGISRFYKATFGAQANPNLAGLSPEEPLHCRVRKGYWLKVSLPNSYGTAACVCAHTHVRPVSVKTACRVGSLLPPCKSQESHSGHQVQTQTYPLNHAIRPKVTFLEKNVYTSFCVEFLLVAGNTANPLAVSYHLHQAAHNYPGTFGFLWQSMNVYT